MIYFLLFIEFFKIGLFSIGGGLATLPFLYELADKYHWIDSSMISNMIAVSESTPGPIGINMATYCGFKVSGILGGIIASLALVVPAFFIIIFIFKFLNKFNENFYIQSMFYGIKPAVIALIIIPCITLMKNSFLSNNYINIKSLIVFFTLFILVWKFKKHPIFYIILGAILGLLLKL
ncbi:MAG: chromate transporter [Clostridium perfringens]|nr:chromate transporter [Clostridium perfringens]